MKLSSVFNTSAPYIALVMGGALAGGVSAMGIDYVFAKAPHAALLRQFMLTAMPLIAGISALGQWQSMDGYERATISGAVVGFAAKSAQLLHVI